MERKGIRYLEQGARRIHPQENRIELEDGCSVPYHYLVIATGPDLAFDEVPGLGPSGSHAINLSRRSCRQGEGSL
jgi:sulfide:quinone oxidoreductase